MGKSTEEYTQLSLFDFDEEPVTEEAVVTKDTSKWADGTIVINICNNKEYTVKNDGGDLIEVFDKDRGYLIMARSDLKYKAM
ncbi:MAG: hypothetical protein IKP29_10355 [Pseudobutyrivibrio sp.]|nr:hypothetical protein [Pseudobutyrivibrio sp.]